MTRPRGSPGAEGAPLLSVWHLRKSFGGLTAVAGATFTVRRGSITGLIGPNGAGKSTLFDLVTGVARPDGGSVTLDGRELVGSAPDAIARAGVARTFQTPRIFPSMSVWENVLAAGPDQPGEHVVGALFGGRAVARREAELRERAIDVLEFLGLADLAGRAARELSGGQRKLLSLGRTLMMDPTLVLLDEPAAGVNATMTRTLMRRIREVNERGVSVLLVEHDMDVIMDLCHHVVVMHQGSVLAEGPPSVVQRDPRVLEAYLGGAP